MQYPNALEAMAPLNRPEGGQKVFVTLWHHYVMQQHHKIVVLVYKEGYSVVNLPVP